MQYHARSSRSPASSNLGVPRNTTGRHIEPGRCRNRYSHPTQYPRFHEIAHSLGVGYTEYGRAQAEVLVDTVTYVVLSGQVGLDVGGESIPYVAGWGEQGALDAIREFAGTIDQIARQIEDAITPASAPIPAEHPRKLKPVA
jgi:hypothetical protein